MRSIPGAVTLAIVSLGGGSLPAQAPGWDAGTTCYEIFIRSYSDSDGDGIGDLQGLIGHLDYINDGDPTGGSDLGAGCIWLMPVAESPSYHGYDVSDYYRVDPDYGTNDDFREFMAAAHRRGIRVMVDMVLNHSSREHPHFQAALADTASPYRHWYRFAPRPLDLGPWGVEAWRKSPVRDEYYYGIFSPDMPDLNYETPAVRSEGEQIADFWLRQMDVDGFRLDAVPYLVEDGDCKMSCAGTHAYLAEYAAHIDSTHPGAFTVGEVWVDIASMPAYYPDQLTSYFAFELADSLLSVVKSGNAAGLLPGYLRFQSLAPGHRWSPFLGNHDTPRTGTVLGGDVARERIAATLLLTLPGLPFVYYGEEIGMTGDKPDPRLRTPMPWTAGPGVGFTTGTPWEAPQPDAARTNVAAQDRDPASLLNLYRRLIHLRRANPALGEGRLVPLDASDPHLVAYLRQSAEESVLVIANLGDAAVDRPTIRSAGSVLPPGRHVATSLLAGPDGAVLTVATDGMINGYRPAASLGSRAAMVLRLDR